MEIKKAIRRLLSLTFTTRKVEKKDFYDELFPKNVTFFSEKKVATRNPHCAKKMRKKRSTIFAKMTLQFFISLLMLNSLFGNIDGASCNSDLLRPEKLRQFRKDSSGLTGSGSSNPDTSSSGFCSVIINRYWCLLSTSSQ